MRSAVAAGSLLLALLLAGCSSGSGAASGPEDPTASSNGPGGPSSTSGSAPATSGAAGDSGCPSSENGMPAGADAAPTLDVDGDGARRHRVDRRLPRRGRLGDLRRHHRVR